MKGGILMLHLSSKYVQKPVIFKRENPELNIVKEMKIVDEKRRQRYESAIVKLPAMELHEAYQFEKQIDYARSKKQNEEIMKQKEIIRNKKHINLEKERKARYALINKDAEKLADRIKRTLKDHSDEEISDIVVRTLNDDQKFNKVADIYVTSAKSKGEEYIDPIRVTREALNKVLRETKSRIEVKHREFPRVEPVKRMKF